MSGYSIIPLSEKPELAEACAAWSYGEWGSQVPTRNLLQVLEDYKATASGVDLPVTWLAMFEDKPVGMVRLKKIDHIDREDLKPWLGSLYVHPLHRGKGLGEKLCTVVHKTAKDVYGFDKIYLFTGTAAGLYRKLGYKDIGVVSDRSGLKDGKNLMMKEL